MSSGSATPPKPPGRPRPESLADAKKDQILPRGEHPAGRRGRTRRRGVCAPCQYRPATPRRGRSPVGVCFGRHPARGRGGRPKPGVHLDATHDRPGAETSCVTVLSPESHDETFGAAGRSIARAIWPSRTVASRHSHRIVPTSPARSSCCAADAATRSAQSPGRHNRRSASMSPAARRSMERVLGLADLGYGRDGVAGGEPELADRRAGGPGIERGQV